MGMLENTNCFDRTRDRECIRHSSISAAAKAGHACTKRATFNYFRLKDMSHMMHKAQCIVSYSLCIDGLEVAYKEAALAQLQPGVIFSRRAGYPHTPSPSPSYHH